MIKKWSRMAVVLGVLALLTAPANWAQAQVPQAARPGARFYNPQAVETLAGKVVTVNRRAPRRPGRPAMVSLVLQTGQGKVMVHLGPADYMDSQAVKLAAGDLVEVKGVRFTRGNRIGLIAGEVQKGDQVLLLRDGATGQPLWPRPQR
jgi:hypothetical protein